MEGVCVRQRAQHSSCALHGQSSIFCKAQLRKENSTVFLDTVEAFPFAGVRRDVRQSTRADVQACGTVRCSAVRTHGSALFAFYPLLDGEKSGQKFSFSGSAHRISFLRPNTALWYWCCKATVQQTVLTGMYAPPQRYCQTPWSDRHGKDSRTRFLFSLEYENRSQVKLLKRETKGKGHLLACARSAAGVGVHPQKAARTLSATFTWEEQLRGASVPPKL